MESKERKSMWLGVMTFVIAGLISNLYFKIPWFPTLALASAFGIIAGVLAYKLSKKSK